MPSIKLWGIVVWIFGLLLFVMLATNFVQTSHESDIARSRSDENVKRFAELLANQQIIVANEAIIIESNKSLSKQNEELLDVIRHDIAEAEIIIQHVDHFTGPVEKILDEDQMLLNKQEDIAKQVEESVRLWREHVREQKNQFKDD